MSSTSTDEREVVAPREWATRTLEDCGFDHLTNLNGDPMHNIDGVLQNLVMECTDLTLVRGRFTDRPC